MVNISLCSVGDKMHTGDAHGLERVSRFASSYSQEQNNSSIRKEFERESKSTVSISCSPSSPLLTPSVSTRAAPDR